MIDRRKLKDLIPAPRAIRLRERADTLRAKAEELIRESDALLASAVELEKDLRRESAARTQ
jgi:hypothetical protein